ncbi:multidrug effflux MFS transporter [Thalassobius sp. Cn5-15]|uniref:multidrug effflux MFS transporter n=1 Tax=Thalassobius sp. Cn5-15 TaxID=2917763 RepID=UPI001EF25A97|nr:multidrug effflux MFS transporter [Thalassobius sp. Cn5-15]MCG7493118.1 multidrug effflux MFS transporter [Thalassobius sp. Cn5-15]
MTSQPQIRFLDRQTPPHVATLVVLAGMSALAINVFLPSLPSMARYFQTDYAFIQLSIALYLGVNAVLQLFIGPLSDRYGRRPVLLWATALFALATLGCLLSPNAEVFMVFRMMQAVIAAAIVLSRAVIRDLYPQDQAASVMGYVTMGMALIPMLAPALGGALDILFGWKASFILLLVCSLMLLTLIYHDVGETATNTGTPLRQQIREYPLILTSHRFWCYALASALSSGAFFAYLGGAPYLGANLYQISPTTLGMWMATPGLGYFFGNYITGRFAARFGVNTMVLWGTLMATFGTTAAYLISLAGFTAPLNFFGAMVLVGLGNGLALPNAAAGMLSVRPQLAGTAAGLGSTLLIGGGAALSAYSGGLVQGARSDLPLIALMALSSALSVLCILYVMRRDRQLAAA